MYFASSKSSFISKTRLVAFLIVCLFAFGTLSQTQTTKQILQFNINGAIGPATADYIKRAFESVQLNRVELVIIKIDTPGGLDSSMRSIIKLIVNSPIPVVTYVTPQGARAASAGTYILYASHIAAMSPGTNLGAATPIQIGGVPQPQPGDNKPGSRSPGPKSNDKNETPADNASALRRKIVNDAVAYITSLAQLHDRNEKWAEKAVREGASLPAQLALKQNVINFIATDTADLLRQLNGQTVKVHGRSLTLKTTGLIVTPIEPDWRSRFLSIITDPNVAYILMLFGIYGLIFEFSNPGIIIPGVVGAICLVLALYAFQLLPISYTGMALILLGVALMVAEAFQPSFGALGIGGLVAFVIGSIILMDTKAPGFAIDLSVIIVFAIISGLVFVLLIGMVFKSRRRHAMIGLEQLIGSIATVKNDFNHKGTVTIHGELWSAQTHKPLSKNQQVRVTAADGLTLTVEPLNENSSDTVTTVTGR